MARFLSAFPQKEGKVFIFDSYGYMPSVVARNPNISFGAKAVYAYLMTYVNSDQAKQGDVKAWPSRDRMMHEMGMSVNTLTKYIRELRENGLMEVEQHREKGEGNKTIYSNNVYVMKVYLPDPSLCHKNCDTENEQENEVSVTHSETLTSCDTQKVNPSNTMSFSNTNDLSNNTYAQTAENKIAAAVDNSPNDNGNDNGSRAVGPIDSVESTGAGDHDSSSSVKKKRTQSKKARELRRALRHEYPAEFEAFWQEYPRKVAKGQAFQEWQFVIDTQEVTNEQLIKAVKAFRFDMEREQRDPSKIIYASRWFRKYMPDYIATDSNGTPPQAATMYERYMRILENIDDDGEGGKGS